MKQASDSAKADPVPQTWRDLESWVRRSLSISPELEAQFFTAIDAVFARHERLWHLAKQDAMNELASAFADRLVHARMEAAGLERRIGDVTRHFEGVVARLTERSLRAPETTLLNLAQFTERLEAFLTFERRSRWCAVGMVDVAGLHTYIETLGQTMGDRIVDTVALLLQEQVRDGDLLARDVTSTPEQLHGRAGGDKFCFMMPSLPSCQQGYAIAERFRGAVSRYNWTAVDSRLDSRPIRADVGVVCLKLGPMAERRTVAPELAASLLSRAETLMSTAKGAAASAPAWARVEFRDDELIDVPQGERQPVLSETEHGAPSGAPQ